MDAHKRYAISLLVLALVGVIVLLSASYYLQPLSGDMTRVGGYAENDFGWNQPQRVFANAPFLHLSQYDQYADVLVLGDSFSFGSLDGSVNMTWQQFFSDSTGLTVATINHYTKFEPIAQYGPDLLYKIVNGETFQNHPPRLFILEVIERQLDILPIWAGNCQLGHTIEHKPDIKQNPSPPNLVEVNRKTKPPSLQQQIGYARKYLYGLVSKHWDKDQAVYQVEMSTPKLFSNKLSDKLLGYKDDFKILTWNDQYLANIRCNLMNAQNLVQKNGKTLFVAMIVPDKLSAYSNVLKDKSYLNTSIIDRLAADPSLNLVRIDRPLSKLIDDGVVDVYLPNDMHWGYRGHEAAAAALVQYLVDFSGK